MQSFLLVLLVSITAGIGAWGFEGLAIIKLPFIGIISWTVEAILTFVIGRFVLPMPGTGLTPPSVARAITYAQAPGLLIILVVIPGIRSAVLATSIAWQLVATTAAFKHSFAWSLRRAIAGVTVGAPLFALVMWGTISTIS